MTIITGLGWAVVHSLWQCTLIAGLAAMALSLLRDRHARHRYRIACVSLALMLIAPGTGGPVNLGPNGLVAEQRAFLRHDLHEFQDRRVADLTVRRERAVHLTHGARPALPDHAEDFELAGGWKDRWGPRHPAAV